MDHNQFSTSFDSMLSNIVKRQADFNRGLNTGKSAAEFHIGRNGIWSTTNKDGSTTFSYERLGYHANTAYFFQGVLESGVAIVDHRQR